MKETASSRQKIVCIVGPTACHKTELSIELAKRTNGEIVSADSVQVYFDMDIGSAKPPMEERQGVPHHMIDCVPIDTADFSVALFRSMAIQSIDEILQREHTPIVVGGSGLYINALTYPLGFAIPKNDEIRALVSMEYDKDPLAVYERLKQADPVSGEKLHPNDKKRIVRALEVYDCSGQPLSGYGADFLNTAGEQTAIEPMMIGLTMDRELLYQRINLRVDRMIEQGLIEEAREIYESNYDRNLPAMRSIGYQQLFSYFDGACSLDEAVEKIKQDTRRFAKRQLTWFRRDARIKWYDVTNWDSVKDETIERLAKEAHDWMRG